VSGDGSGRRRAAFDRCRHTAPLPSMQPTGGHVRAAGSHISCCASAVPSALLLTRAKSESRRHFFFLFRPTNGRREASLFIFLAPPVPFAALTRTRTLHASIDRTRCSKRSFAPALRPFLGRRRHVDAAPRNEKEGEVDDQPIAARSSAEMPKTLVAARGRSGREEQ